MPKVGGRRKKNKCHKQLDPEEEKYMPKTFIFKKGKCSPTIQQLIQDLRKCFYPNTAMKLQNNVKMSFKSYIKAAKYYSVNNLIALQESKQRKYIRFMKINGGQMIFRMINYCRMRDILNNRGGLFSYTFKEPLLVLNGFNVSSESKSMARALQLLFPPVNLSQMQIKKIKRVVSFTYQSTNKTIYFRHYKIMLAQGGLSSTFKQLLKQNSIDLSKFHSISEYLNFSSEIKQGQQNQQTVKLLEIGPRMKLKFISYTAFEKEQQQQKQQN